MEFLQDSNWIWSDPWEGEDREVPRIVYFRKQIELDGSVESATINISADSRYKLYINGKLVEVGPEKGDAQIWFYDTVDLASYLKQGENVLAVKVLRYPEDKRKGAHSVIRTATPGLYLMGEIRLEEKESIALSADESWMCYIDRRIEILAEEEQFAPLYSHEKAEGNPETAGWMRPGYDASDWKAAKPYIRLDVPGSVSPGNLNARTIPFMYRRKKNFSNIIDIKKSKYKKEEWNTFLKEGQELTIPAGSEEIVEIDAGEEMTGYLHLLLEAGKGSKIEILQAESYIYDELCGPAQVPLKKDRCDFVNGHLEGYTDEYLAGGFGTEEQAEEYETFWFRTFRFIHLKIKTGEEDLTLKSFYYEETGYPLKIATKVKTSDESLDKIWEISARTLQRCMHETYEDCPYYEQLQYAMDSRVQILYTYAVSADDRLARKCMDDFRRAQRQDGLLNCSYPNCNVNVIPGFSIYYIFMVYDHMMYFGDKDLVQDHLPTIERILRFFDRHLVNQGYVDKIGGILMNAPFWSFVDWAEQWNPTTGMPPAGLTGPLTMESLLYIMGLQYAAELSEYVQREDMAAQYRKRADKVIRAVRKYCIGENGMIQDGPGVEDYSQQCQVFGILTGTLDQENGRENLLRTVKDTENYTQCTVAMRFYLFRALEKTGLYEYTDQYWEAWRTMISNHCTTCVESESYARSECHAWGALALYELPSVTLGIRPAAPGYKKISIHPIPGYLTHAEGMVKTPAGNVKVAWKLLKDSQIKLDYEATVDVEISMEHELIHAIH